MIRRRIGRCRRRDHGSGVEVEAELGEGNVARLKVEAHPADELWNGLGSSIFGTVDADVQG